MNIDAMSWRAWRISEIDAKLLRFADSDAAPFRFLLKQRPEDHRCDPKCPGWGIFDTEQEGRDLEIERCDECMHSAGMDGLVYDQHFYLLPEALVALMKERHPAHVDYVRVVEPRWGDKFRTRQVRAGEFDHYAPVRLGA